MSVPTLQRSSKKKTPTTLKATFDRNRRKIYQLRTQLEEQKRQSEIAFALYHSNLRPKQQEAGELITKYLLRIIDLTRKPKALSGKQRKALNGFLERDLSLVFNLLPFEEVHSEVKGLYKTVFGKESSAEFYEEVSELEELFKADTGVDIDLSHLNPDDSPEELYAKLTDAVRNKRIEEFGEIPRPPEKPKSKKQLLKEQKALELKNLQTRNLSSIYKRLAKEFHPDLEYDQEKRIEKVALMKRLTVAYENHDLLSLLALESEWLVGVDYAGEIMSEESLKSFNALLKGQIEELKQEIAMVSLDPRYMEMHPIVQRSPDEPVVMIEHAIEDCDELMQNYRMRLDDLEGQNPLTSLKQILDYHADHIKRTQLEESQMALLADLFDDLFS